MKSPLHRIFDLVAIRPANAKGPTLLAISGTSCSGKTTLAGLAVEHGTDAGYKVELIHFDDYLRPGNENQRQQPEHVGYLEDAFDYAGLVDAVTGIRSDPHRPDLLIVEGEFLLRSEYRDLWDISVWIEIDDELALRRGVSRDAGFFGSEDEARRIYLERCLPANHLHRDRDDPAVHADVVLTAQPKGDWKLEA